MKRPLSAAIACVMAAASVLAQAPAPGSVVWVQTTVRDAQGQLARSLTASEFRVVAGDEPRPVAVVSKNELPMALSIMMDLSDSMAFQRLKVRRSAELLVKEFGRGDRVNIGAFQGRVMVTQRFTANPRRILESLEIPATGADERCEVPGPTSSMPTASALPKGGTAMWDAVWCGVNVLLREIGKPFAACCS